MNIVIMGGFKTGTHTILHTLIKNINDKSINIERFHIDKNKLLTHNIDVLLLTFQYTKNINPSIFFQDILVPLKHQPFGANNFLSEYANYSVDEKKQIILNTDINKLVEFYKKTFLSCKTQYTFEETKKIYNDVYGIEIDNTQNIQYFNVKYNNKNIKIIAFDINYFGDNLTNIFEFIDIKRENIKLHYSNIGYLKWYGSIYKEFNKLL